MKVPYNVTITIDEEEETVIHCICEDCTASEGGCKHSVAFLFWLHRRGEEPSVTETESYWKATSLSKAGKSVEFMNLSALTGKNIPPFQPKDSTFVESFKGLIKDQAGGIFDIIKEPKFLNTSLHQLSISYKEEVSLEERSVCKFLEFISSKLSEHLCSRIEYSTREQSKSSAWYEHRYGRITASKIYEASRCRTPDGSLAEAIMGAVALPETRAIKRGCLLEDDMIRIIEQRRHINIKKCGIFLSSKYPVFGASPDGITDTFVIEVKCPFKEKTVKNYIVDNSIQPRYLAQIQLRMYFAKRQYGLFCVADPDFEATKEVTEYEVTLDEALCLDLLRGASVFWSDVIYSILMS